MKKKQVLLAALFLFLSITTIGVLSSLTPFFETLELKNYDFMLFLRGVEETPPDIVVVAIDRFSLDVIEEERQMPWPWKRSIYGELIAGLNRAGARAIAFDIIFDQERDPEDDAKMVEAVQNSEVPVVLAATIETVVSSGFTLQQDVLPFDGLIDAGADYAYTIVNPDRDAVVRHARLTVDEEPTLALLVYEILNGQIDLEGLPIVASEMSDPEILINYVGPAQTVKTVSFYQALGFEESLPPDTFKDRVVFVGRSETTHEISSGDTEADMFTSPLDFLGGTQQMPGVEVHANIFTTLNQGRFLGQASNGSVFLVVVLMCMLCTFLMLYMGTIRNKILCAGLVLFGYFFMTWVAFLQWDYWLLGLHPFFGGALVVVMNTIYQYGASEKEKRHIEQMLTGYVSKDVINTITEDPSKLELGGVEVEATVLFSDIAGFSRISEQITPQELSQKLNEYFSVMGDAIMVRQGMINKYIGDAIMAIWGAPLPNDRHAILACESALEMKRLVDEMPDFNARFGLNTGNMVAGNLGHHERMEYTVIGDAVNLSSRLEGANKVYGTSVMISQFTEEKVRGHFLTRQLDLIRVLGRDQPVKVFEVVALKNGSDGLDPAVLNALEEKLGSYERILQAYTDREWERACSLVEKHLHHFPDDSVVSKVYRVRCQAYAKSPPADDWDGVSDMKSK